ncbi:MAG: PHP domain-containing protein [Chloroflexota bacterium]
MGLADLHLHTTHSHDGTFTPRAALSRAVECGLDVLAITDHNVMSGAFEALELAPEYGIEVVPGCEISTAEGHLVALYITQPVPPGLSLAATVRKVAEQDGLCVVAHPTSWKSPASLSLAAIQHALEQPGIAETLVGIEAFVAGSWYTLRHPALSRFVHKSGLVPVGGSDAHVLRALGLVRTGFAGKTAADLRAALIEKSVQVRQTRQVSVLGLVAEWLFRYQLRRSGWITCAPSPEFAPQMQYRPEKVAVRRD